jgi:thymidylate synthase (FAD)
VKVKLISYTQPPGLSKEDCIEDLVAHCARVSNPANQGKSGRKLLEYLMKEGHWSPFEMVSICLEIVTTRDIARQILRHRSFSFQEFSQRYADPTQTLGYETRETRLQDKKNRQNSIDNQDLNLDAEWKYKQQQIIDAADHAYRWARANNIAKEQARCVLPEGNTLSRLYMNGTLRSWIHYISQRDGNGTQREHQEIAIACKDAIAIPFPLIKEIL